MYSCIFILQYCDRQVLGTCSLTHTKMLHWPGHCSLWSETHLCPIHTSDADAYGRHWGGWEVSQGFVISFFPEWVLRKRLTTNVCFPTDVYCINCTKFGQLILRKIIHCCHQMWPF